MKNALIVTTAKLMFVLLNKLFRRYTSFDVQKFDLVCLYICNHFFQITRTGYALES